MVTLRSDQLHSDFKAYRWQTLSFEDISGGTIDFMYAGTNGHTVGLWESSDLTNWTAIWTNAIGSSNLLEVPIQFSTAIRLRFYRTEEN